MAASTECKAAGFAAHDLAFNLDLDLSLAIGGALTLVDACGTMNWLGRLAQRLERSVYTRKVVRSNRTVPTTVSFHSPFHLNRLRSDRSVFQEDSRTQVSGSHAIRAAIFSETRFAGILIFQLLAFF